MMMHRKVIRKWCFTEGPAPDTLDETLPNIKGFNYSEETIWNNFRNLVSLKFTYYFYKGKSRCHAGKRISNFDNDSGLTQSNTAK